MISRKVIAYNLAVVALAVAGLQWWQIVYRLYLFFHDYSAEPFANHVADGVFFTAYLVNGVIIAVGIMSVILMKKEKLFIQKLEKEFLNQMKLLVFFKESSLRSGRLFRI